MRHPGAPASEERVPALLAPPASKDNPLTRSKVGLAGLGFLVCMLLVCLLSLPFALSSGASGVPRYNEGTTAAARLPPVFATPSLDQAQRLDALVPQATLASIAAKHNTTTEEVLAARSTSNPAGNPATSQARAASHELQAAWPRWFLGTDALGRSLLWRVLAGGGISLAVGLLAAAVSVSIGTLWGSIAGLAGGRVDGIMMRIVDVLYGLPYVLLVVLLAVASDSLLSEWISRSKARTAFVEQQARLLMQAEQMPAGEAPQTQTRAQTRTTARESARTFLASNPSVAADIEAQARSKYPQRDISPTTRGVLDLATLLIAIGGVSWLTMARVVRGQVMSLRGQPFMEAARALGLSRRRIFLRHVLPNLAGTISVYATLTVPQAILQESFLSFLGIGVKPPLASWGNLAADGLGEINPYQSHWWLPLFPCLLLSLTLLSLNFTGEALREALDPKRARKGASP